MTIDILCKVVDNFGDIGLVYRLAKALADLDPQLRLRLHVDDLESFAALCPGIDPGQVIQEHRLWTVLRWGFGREGLAAEPPRLVLECFACGRPETLEGLLFDPTRTQACLIVNIEHLSAETWADELHLMPSATRSGLVRKVIFMPGFTAATGGLIIDRVFAEAARVWMRGEARDEKRQALLVTIDSIAASARASHGAVCACEPPPDAAFRLWIPLFAYEWDYVPMVRDLARFEERQPLLVLVAPGRSAGPFLSAWEESGRPFPALALPFLPQETWDELLLASDVSIVRGEESLSRAALSGKPFLWQAYRQEDEHQRVKAQALIDRMRPCFPARAFAALETLSAAFNRGLGPGGDPGLFETFLEALPALRPGFRHFADGLWKNGDLAARLLAYLRSRPECDRNS
ncbi:MAG: elongation factor P maturation arginine rhamnosyltransferase EarP [Spirochaetota bacterium]